MVRKHIDIDYEEGAAVASEASSHTECTPLLKVARIPTEGDNAAIAIKTLPAGLQIIDHENKIYWLKHIVLEGHRFVIRHVAKGEKLLSWSMPFGIALENLSPGTWIYNENCLKSFASRELPFSLPTSPNFQDYGNEYVLDEENFRAGEPLPRIEPPDVMVYDRGESRGCGTRNYIVIIAVTSVSASMARRLCTRFRTKLEGEEFQNISGVVPVAHTEGGEGVTTHNLEHILRCLSGFIVHPNCGGVIIIDNESGAFTASDVFAFAEKENYPIEDVLHSYLKLTGDTELDFAAAERIIDGMLPAIAKMCRVPRPASCLKIALQCGGSDAFSGISANPLVGLVSQRIVQWGGAANLAETDELIGAESYVLQNVKDIETCRSFVEYVHKYSTLAGYHGHSAEGNPSAGNIYRGLYNIYLKSLGAAIKRPPCVRLEHVIKYGQIMRSGFHFMDSPGNDLESVGGQSASGCNIIFFTTGNGAVTNFPFVPTIKFITTTARFEIMPGDMDVNAGRYLDGMPMNELAEEVIDLTCKVASGRVTAGERAGHAQVQIWREWSQNRPSAERACVDLQIKDPHVPSLQNKQIGKIPTLMMIKVSIDRCVSASRPVFSSNYIALILPTSLCSSEIAGVISKKVNERLQSAAETSNKHVICSSLAHTEGCGSSDGHNVKLFVRTMLGHMISPMVGPRAFLEHGCEKTHNSYMQNELKARNINIDTFGWFSLQLGGGIAKSTNDAVNWILEQLRTSQGMAVVPEREECSAQGISIGVASVGIVSKEIAESLGKALLSWVAQGGNVVVAQNSSLLCCHEFVNILSIEESVSQVPTLEYGAHPIEGSGEVQTGNVHIMQTFNGHWVETMSGLGGTGVQAIFVAGTRPLQAHPFIPTALIPSSSSVALSLQRSEFDCIVEEGDKEEAVTRNMIETIAATLSGKVTKQKAHENVDFQISRGPLGFSM